MSVTFEFNFDQIVGLAKQLSPEKIHPFRRAEASKPKPFNRENWKLLKSRIKGRKN